MSRYQSLPTDDDQLGMSDGLEFTETAPSSERSYRQRGRTRCSDLQHLEPLREKNCSKPVLDQISQLSWIMREMAAHHMLELVVIILSFSVCVLTGAVHMELVDLSFFHATGLLLAVLVSLRAKNAMTRRTKLMAGVLQMMNSGKNMLDISTGPTWSETKATRQRLKLMLAFCFAEIAKWVMNGSEEDLAFQDGGRPHWHGPRLEQLAPQDQEAVFCLRAKAELGISPRPLLLYLRQFCDELFDPDKECHLYGRGNTSGGKLIQSHCLPLGAQDLRLPAARREPCEEDDQQQIKFDRISVIRRWHRNIEVELHNLTAQFDTLLMFREELHTPQFRWVLSSVILLYVALYPWCVIKESTTVLCLTTMGIAFVFYGLNTMTEQLENPILQPGQGFNLERTFQKMFADMEGEEIVREKCEKFLAVEKEQSLEITEEQHKRFVEKLLRETGRAWRCRTTPTQVAPSYVLGYYHEVGTFGEVEQANNV